MHSISIVASLLAPLTVIPITAAIPIVTPKLEARTDCDVLTTPPDPSCWTVLNMTGYLNNWVTTDGKACLIQTKDFSGCYLSIVTPGTFPDCSIINPQSCDYNIGRGATTPQQVHVLYNIYAINNFFNQWNIAIDAAATQVLGDIGEIVANIDPPKTGFPISGILTILSAGLSLIPGPLGLATSTLTKTAQATIEVIATGIGQIPALTGILFPTGTIDSETVQAADMSAQLSSLTATLSGRIDQALKLAETDFPTFLSLAATTTFYATVWDDTTLTTNIVQALNAFIISICLEGNNIHGVVALDTSPQALAANVSASQLAYDISCSSYDQYGVCNAWYYDSAANNAYTLNNYDAMQHNYYSSYELWFGKGWTTGEALFVNAANCAQSGKAGQPPTVDFSGGNFNFQCISQLRMYTWDMTCEYKVGATCEYTDGPIQGGFGQQNTKGAAGGWNNAWSSGGGYEQLVVPAGYLGPWITVGKNKISNQ